MPFFIIGSGRSGTTLLRAILCRHPSIAIPPEAYGLVNSIKKYIRYNGLDWKDRVNVVLGEFQSHSTFDYWETELFNNLGELYNCSKADRSLALILDYIYQTYLNQHKPQATKWGDKTPFNTLRLKWINKVFPQASYIHILRDGRDVVSSYLKAKLMPGVQDACVRWIQSVEAVDEFERKIGTSRILTVRYEDIVTNPTMQIRILCDFLGIDFIDDMLENTHANLGDDSLAHLKNAKKPINQTSIGKWRKELTAEEKRLTTKLISSKLIKKGYNID